MPARRTVPLTGPAALAVAALALAALALAGCASASSTVVGTGAVSPASGASGAATVSAAPVAASSAAASSAPAAPSSPASSPAPATVYFAESGEVNGTVVYRPGCGAGCQLSGDGTTALWDMTWTSWTGSTAVGHGTEKIDDCNPDCAQGTLHAVPVTVTFSKPVTAGCGASARRYWTQAAFSWPHGLPAVLSGADAPANPFTYPGLGGTGSCA
jgi:hypothetical protein